ncbi:hypothetical protein [Mycobacteroides franklinii]|uniref:hypothetical protein n=1 Tax=Mycobacteroides franklinii TaxID=948102 RepID=UPI0012FFA350|nr:hypothetical protein [Mycobacteroides franklinii]
MTAGTGTKLVAVTVSVTVSVDAGAVDVGADGDAEGVVTEVMGTSGGTVAFWGPRSRYPGRISTSTTAATSVPMIQIYCLRFPGARATGINCVGSSSPSLHALAVCAGSAGSRSGIPRHLRDCSSLDLTPSR